MEWITHSDSHWVGGIQYDIDCTEVAITMMECVSGAPSPNPTKSATWSQLTRGARAFTLYSEVDCSPADGEIWESGQAMALRGLANSAPTGLERVLWTGATNSAPVFPNLTTIGPLYASAAQLI